MVRLLFPPNRQVTCLLLLFALGRIHGGVAAADWVERVPLVDGVGQVKVPADGIVYFLRFGRHTYEPDDESAREAGFGVERMEPVTVAPFQELAAVGWRFPESLRGKDVRVGRKISRDAFWDQILTVDSRVVGDPPRYKVVETGEFGAALPLNVRALSLSAEEIEAQRQSLVDPMIPHAVDREIPWDELGRRALPLDFQKVLLASRNDSSPGFAFQNGQWLTTWLSRDLPEWTKEDHWFAPALLIGDTLVRPAPLSAETRFEKTQHGVTIPVWTLTWQHRGGTVTQTMGSVRDFRESTPRVWVKFRLNDLPDDARLAIGLGRRPNVHYWDDTKRERKPVPFFTLEPGYELEGQHVFDQAHQPILSASAPFQLEPLGPAEMLLVFEPKYGNVVYVGTPQKEALPGLLASTRTLDTVERQLIETASSMADGTGARARLPSREWQERIDIWRSQVAAITARALRTP